MKGIVLAALVVVVAGCQDKAAPDYETCLNLADSGDVHGAARACSKANDADKTSKAGQAALTKLKDELWPAETKLNLAEQKAAADAKAKADAEADRQVEASCKGVTRPWMTICGSSGMQRFNSRADCLRMTNDLETNLGATCDPCTCVGN